MARPILSQQIVRDLLHYDPETGIFTWRLRDRKYCVSDKTQKSWNARFAGKKAGFFTEYGYIKIRIFKYNFFAHRIAYLYMTGSFPALDMDIDHKDHSRSNNAFENLRVVSKAVNTQNSFIPYRSNKLQIRGVCQVPSKKFVAEIKINGKAHYLGRFPTAGEAGAAYLAAKQVLHPDAVQTVDA